LYGLNPAGYHLTNVLLHAAAVLLLFGLLWRMTGFLWRSAFVAAVFAVHPLRAESVAWIAERKDVLSGVFFMLTLWAYIAYARRPSSLGRYLTVAGLFALGLMAKPMLVTLPFVLLLLDYWPLRRMETATDGGSWSFPRRVILEKVPLLVLTTVSCVITFSAQTDSIIPIDTLSLSSRLANAPVACMAYIGKLFYPVGLAVFYPHPGGGLPIWKVVLSTLALAGISLAAIVWRRRFPYLFVGWFWYLGMLAPVIGLAQAGSQSMADRYTYLPQIGLVLSMTWGIADSSSLWRGRRWVSMASVAALLVLMALAHRQVSYWRNSETIWTHTLNCTAPIYIVHYNLGIALADSGKYVEAVDHYQKALEIWPASSDAHNNLGMALAGLGRIDEAVVHYQKALANKPGDADVYTNLGNAFAARGQLDEAIADYEKALSIKPDSAEAHHNYGVALERSGQIDAAVAHYQKALEINPIYADNYISLGNAMANRGQIDAAISHYRKALEINPDYAGVHYNLGMILVRSGQVDEAVSHFQMALEIQPDYAEARYYLNLALQQRNQPDRGR
jgi:tetratricopeptide (TPR) repeat protein